MDEKPSKLIVANWKMNKNIVETEKFFKFLKKKINCNNNIIFGVPFLNIPKAVEMTYDTNFQIFAQNCHFENSGAYTGEISPKMLYDAGVTGVILGHSERRNYFFENDELINQKLKAVLSCGLNAVLCVGESLEEKQTNISNEIIAIQIKKILHGVDSIYAKKICVAYEPCWAIGSGMIPKISEISSVCKFLSSQIRSIFFSEHVKILYGGSVNLENFEKILNIKSIDGILIGGASLNANEFSKFIK